MKMSFVKTAIISAIFLTCSVNAAEILKSRNMTQAAYAGVGGAVLGMGNAKNNKAFFEQDFKKMPQWLQQDGFY